MRIIATLSILLLVFQLDAQNRKNYYFEYQEAPLDRVLADLENRYGLLFTYSDDRIALDMPVNTRVETGSLDTALNRLFSHTGIIAVQVGEQWVLQWDEEKWTRVSLREEKKPSRVTIERTSRFPLRPPGFIDRKSAEEHYELSIALPPSEAPVETERLMQFSLLPYIGTNGWESDKLTNRLSVNLIWGHHGGVKGTEVGGLFNSTRWDVQGIQWSGLGNIVFGETRATQISLLGINTNLGKVQGLQFAGTANILTDKLIGIQIAGAANLTLGDIRGVQIAGGLNFAARDVYTQISALANWAGGNVGGVQASLLFNRASWVGGNQVGLVNVCDSIAGVPMGLISFVRKGYRQLELSFAEDLHLNLGARIGVRKFYSIFHWGARVDELSWGIGYGFGTSLTMGRRSWLSAELLGIHVNEKEWWTGELNMLIQTRIALELKLDDTCSLIFGPEYKVLFSRRKDEEGRFIPSSLIPYSMLEQSPENTRIGMWIGGRLGIRF